MGFFRIRKSFKLGPLGRVYLGKKGASLSVGVRGAHVNIGSRGVRTTVGLPGTGISYTSRLGSGATTGPSAVSSGSHVQPTSSNAGVGCLKALVVIFALAFIGGVAQQSSGAAVVVAILIVGVWVFVARTIKKGREAQARKLVEEQQRQYEAYQAEQHRIAAYQAEQQRQAAAEQYRAHLAHEAEQERLTVVRAREASEHAAQEERSRRARWDAFVAKYGEADAHRIWAGRPWIGCDYRMLIDMLGPPADIDEKVLKTKTKHTYKYKPMGGNRYGLRVFLDDEVVTGWEDKGDCCRA